MYVKNKMTRDPYTIESDSPITDAIALMKEKNLKRVPVLKDNKVVGMLTEGDIQKVSPNKATSLSIFEINYLLGKMTVSNAMRKPVFSISENAFLEEAAVMMRTNRISALPVVENGKLVGIITESDIFDAFIELLGFKDSGSRIAVEAEDKPGELAAIATITASSKANISHMAAYERPDNMSDVVIRVDTLDTSVIEKDLQDRGYKIINVTKNDKQ